MKTSFHRQLNDWRHQRVSLSSLLFAALFSSFSQQSNKYFVPVSSNFAKKNESRQNNNNSHKNREKKKENHLRANKVLSLITDVIIFISRTIQILTRQLRNRRHTHLISRLFPQFPFTLDDIIFDEAQEFIFINFLIYISYKLCLLPTMWLSAS